MFLNIQALRAIAALLVVLVHLEVLGAALGLQRSLFDLFAVGVDLFFVISGFIMVHTTSRRRVSPAAFMLGRLARIAPLYWTLTIAVFVVALASPSLLGATQGNWTALLRSLAFLPGERADGTVRPILFVGWSLNLEMAFYLVFAGTLTVKDVTRRVFMGAGLLVLAVVLGMLMRPQLGPELRFLTQPMLVEFAAGMILGWLHPHLPASRAAARLAAAASLPALAALLLAARWPLPGGWPMSLLPACAVVLAALIAEKGGIVLTWQPLQVTGDASYALYLTHPFVTQGWTIAAERAGILQPGTAPLLMAAALGSAVAAGIFIHRHLERPLDRLLQPMLTGTPKTPLLKSGVWR
ncbi:acyltransferase family protein [Sphingomonas sp. LH128]|uniref:acyltransferase family protein n=1 Tax=Sphingomonas sp. LH128 TaxID=473781 RepID=UPI00027C9EF1|nr:acyltransferase [Sphingomonas sp. LH128]EJU14712.1 acyltransferase family protein [Sphingomonas sp. LH128]